MIRGATEVACNKKLSGWSVSAAGLLRGELVLAFLGSQCVGSGRVEVFRPDLLNANLGDGYAGYDFAIALADDDDVGSLVIRLEECDAAILKSGSKVVSRLPQLFMAAELPNLRRASIIARGQNIPRVSGVTHFGLSRRPHRHEKDRQTDTTAWKRVIVPGREVERGFGRRVEVPSFFASWSISAASCKHGASHMVQNSGKALRQT